MSLCRLVFRADYKPSYRFIDNQGKAMELLSETYKDFWNNIKESPELRRLTGEYISKEDGVAHSRILTFEPTALYGTLEFVPGIELSKLVENAAFKNINKLVQQFVHEFNITRFERIGFRVFLFTTIDLENETDTDSSNSVHVKFRDCFKPSIISTVEEDLGEIDDYMVSFDGQAEDALKYHFKAGPHRSNESKRY